MRSILIILFSWISIFYSEIFAQFAPAVGKPGSTALKSDSACFIAWAKGCKLKLGFRDISQPDSGFVNVGDSASALGPALQNGVVSLGDGGSATLTFKNPIKNEIGWDFAVFENAFLDSFLELAFVEVSTDGKIFVRFQSESLTDTSKQTGAFGFTQPEKINNLAGKYRAGFGTPFDLNELQDSVGIDINDIHFVRLIDVVGSMNPKYARRDSRNRKINDLWPTPFPSSGFDLDAVGVIHQNESAKLDDPKLNSSFKIWPNPVNENWVHIQSDEQGLIILYNYLGAEIVSFNIQKGINTYNLQVPTGMYFAYNANLKKAFKIIVQN